MVGYDISRTVTTLGTASAASNLAEGEIIVLDKYGKLLTAGKTIADSDIIYIGQGGKSTYTEVNSQTRRVINYSSPIYGSQVKSYEGLSYVAATQRIATCASTGLTPSTTAGAYDYVIRIVYKDPFVKSQTPGQFIQEYRVTSGAALSSLQALYNAFRTAITADVANARVSGGDTTALTLTGLTNTTAALTDIDGYFFVDFDVFFYQVQLTGTGAGTMSAAGPTVSYNTAVMGSGVWNQIRDMEKAAKAYTGITNFMDFPVPSNVSDFFTVTGKTYDQIVIESEVPYTSSDNQYIKTAGVSTVIALPNNIQTTMTIDVLNILNAWMASCPGAFNAISL